MVCTCQKGEDKKAGHVAASRFTLFPLLFGPEIVYTQPRRSLWLPEAGAQVDSRELSAKSQRSSEAAQTIAQTIRSSQKSKFRSLSGDGGSGLIPGSAPSRPSSPSPSSSPACQTPGPSRRCPAETDLGPRGEGGGADTPPAPEIARGTGKRDGRGGESAGSSRVAGAGGRGRVRARTAPAPQARVSPWPLPQTQTDKKDRQPATKGGGEEPLHPQPGAGWKESGVFLPGASALRGAPGPWAPPPDRQTAGQWAPSRSSGPPGRGSPRLGPGGQRAAPGRAGGGEPRGGAADGQSQQQTDRLRGKRWRRGWRERAARAPAASGARARVSPLHPPASPLLQLGPPPRSPGARPEAWAGLIGRGSGEAESKRASNHRHSRGASSASSPRGDHPASHSPRSFSGPVSSSAPLIVS